MQFNRIFVQGDCGPHFLHFTCFLQKKVFFLEIFILSRFLNGSIFKGQEIIFYCVMISNRIKIHKFIHRENDNFPFSETCYVLVTILEASVSHRWPSGIAEVVHQVLSPPGLLPGDGHGPWRPPDHQRAAHHLQATESQAVGPRCVRLRIVWRCRYCSRF